MQEVEDNGAAIDVTWHEVFPEPRNEGTFLSFRADGAPVTYFVGRNGSGKSRTAEVLAQKFGEAAHRLSTDRLSGVMSFDNYEFGSMPTRTYRGVPIGTDQDDWFREQARKSGIANEDVRALRDEPSVTLRVAAFIKRALHRTIELRERSGFLDPVIRLGRVEYSLFRDEGHGLRELVVLLAAIYRDNWKLLVVDEPELHLHPSMARLWLGELSRECQSSGRRAVVVTHEPTLLRPASAAAMESIVLFRPGRTPILMSDAIRTEQQDRVTASLKENAELVSQLVFSPRPVLVEGVTDVAALTTALWRLVPPESSSQTDLVSCGGAGGVGLWLEIARKLEIDVRAVGDLDALFTKDVQRVMDADAGVRGTYQMDFYSERGVTSDILKDLLTAADKAGAPKTPKGRAEWLSSATGAHGALRSALLAVWADAGLWLHAQGTLEDVLGLERSEKSIANARKAAEAAGAIDPVARWCAFELDLSGELGLLTNTAVESVAHRIMEAQRATPDAEFSRPVGSDQNSDKFVRVEPVSEGKHRITVLTPREYEGWYVEFSRDTPANDLVLLPPQLEAIDSIEPRAGL